MMQKDLTKIGREKAFLIKDLVDNNSNFKNWLWKNGLGVRRRSNGKGHDLYIASKNSKA